MKFQADVKYFSWLSNFHDWKKLKENPALSWKVACKTSYYCSYPNDVSMELAIWCF